jgi:hypothetical protein
MNRTRLPRRVSAAVLAGSMVAILATLTSHAHIGTFSRFLADDFCTYGSLRSHGFFGSQLEWYLHWSGRFSFTWMMNSLHLIGPSVTPWLGVVVLIAWVLAGTLAFRSLTGWGLLGLKGLGLAGLSLTFSMATFSLAPDLYQVLYWQTGLITYSVPLMLLLALGAWLIRRSEQTESLSSWSAVLLAAGLSFVIAGFSETIALLQAVLMGLLAAWVSLMPNADRDLKVLLWACVVGSVAGLGLVAAAPGNAVRQGLMPERAPLPLILQRAFRDAYLFSYSVVKWKWPLLAIAGLAPLAWRSVLHRPGSDDKTRQAAPPWTLLLGFPVLAYSLVAAVMFPSEYALSSYPDGRVLVTAAAVVVALLPSLSRLQLFPAMTVVVVLSLSALVVQQSLVAIDADGEILTDARPFAARWDQRDAQIREAASAGASRMEVASLTHMAGLAEVERDPDTWINRCIAESYGLRSVTPK